MDKKTGNEFTNLIVDICSLGVAGDENNDEARQIISLQCI